MAVRTLPLAFSKHINDTTETTFDEFGAHWLPPTTSSNDFDEEIVPALKKRLQEESARLDNRISRLDVHKQTPSRISPRPDRNTEILQDGLGSDDLIPSEWATGSSATFARVSSRERTRTDPSERAFSAAHYIPTSNRSPQSQQRQMNLAPSLPLMPLSSSQKPYIFDAPTLQGLEGSCGDLSKARAMARRLAKEKEGAGLTTPIMGDDQDSFKYLGEEESKTETESPEQRESKEIVRNRTASTPNGYYRAEGSIGRLKHPPSRSQKQEASMKAENFDRDTSTSKIPLPTSGSMSNFQDERRGSGKEVSISKSVSQPTSFATPPHQDNAGENREEMLMSAYGGLGGERREPSKAFQQKLTYSPPTQDVLDDFGPLGGTPKRVTRRGGESNADEDRERARTDLRSTSTPWDEELLPTVKKRLEQQRILERLSQDDGLVDTWDRNGLPLSRSPAQAKTRSDREGKEERNQQPLQAFQDDGRDTAATGTDESHLRMKRLQEQLDIGIGNSDQTLTRHTQQQQQQQPLAQRLQESHPNHSHNIDQQVIDAKQRTDPNPGEARQEKAQAKRTTTSRSAKEAEADNTGDAKQMVRPSHAANPVEESEAGCCQCTIM
jgi:hypothetical protein